MKKTDAKKIILWVDPDYSEACYKNLSPLLWSLLQSESDHDYIIFLPKEALSHIDDFYKKTLNINESDILDLRKFLDQEYILCILPPFMVLKPDFFSDLKLKAHEILFPAVHAIAINEEDYKKSSEHLNLVFHQLVQMNSSKEKHAWKPFISLMHMSSQIPLDLLLSQRKNPLELFSLISILQKRKIKSCFSNLRIAYVQSDLFVRNDFLINAQDGFKEDFLMWFMEEELFFYDWKKSRHLRFSPPMGQKFGEAILNKESKGKLIYEELIARFAEGKC